MPNKYAADTMALILYLEERKLPIAVSKIFSEFEKQNCELLIPAMVIAEIGYLSERKRIDTNLKEVKQFLKKNKNARIEPMSFEIVETAFQINNIPELHDRLIAATAIFTNAALLTNDPVIHACKSVKVVW